MKKILTLFVAMSAVLSLSAKTVFLNIGTWTELGTAANYEVYCATNNSWVDLVAIEGEANFYYAEIADDVAKVVFCRMDQSLPAHDWSSVLNQTDQLTLPSGKNLSTITAWGGTKSHASWSTQCFLKNNWGKNAASWKKLDYDSDDATWAVMGATFGGDDLVLSCESERVIAPANVNAMINYDAAELSAGDAAMFIYDPEAYSQYDPKASGLIAMISEKVGYAIKYDAEWINMTKDEDTYVLINGLYAGKDVQIVTGHDIRTIKAENINSMMNYEAAELAAGDSVMYIYDPDAYSQYDPKASGLIAMINKKAGYAIKYDAAWKNMAKDDDTYVLLNGMYAGKDIQIATGHDIRAIQAENINVMLNYDAAVLSAGDSVMYIYDPEAYSQYDPKASGLIAMISKKAGYAIKYDAEWINMVKDEDTYVLLEGIYAGKNVQVATGHDIRTITAENINSMMNYEEAELATGDSVMYIYDPEAYSQYDPKASGLIAMINKKAGYAIKYDAAWKNMAKDDDTYVLLNGMYAGKDIQIATGHDIRAIPVENINVMLNYDAAVLSAGDSVMYIYDPEAYSQYDPKASGLIAMISKKAGYAIKYDAAWINMEKDDDTYVALNGIYLGKDVQIANGHDIRPIKAENINSMMNYEEAELAAGDSVIYVYDPEAYSQYDPKASGLIAMINKKAGYAIKYDAAWKNMAKDDDTYVLLNGMYAGKDIQIATGHDIRAIQAENINVMLNYDAAVLSAGDSVMYIYDPEAYSQYDPKASGLIAMISKKAGYAIKYDAAWINMEKDDDTYVALNGIYLGKDVQIANGHDIRPIKAENINSMMNYEEAELAAGDSVIYVYDPEAYSQYDPKASGLIAMINKKAGYAIKYDAAWKNMAKDDDTYVLLNGIYAGKDVQIATGHEIRPIKAENINAMMNYETAELAAGDSVMYIYDPEAYSQYDPKASGLIAMINKKAGYAIRGTWGEKDNSWKNLIVDPEDDDWWVLDKLYFDGKDVQLANGKEIRTIKAEDIETYINYDLAELSAGDTVMFVYRPSLYNRYNPKESGLYAHITHKAGYAIHGTWGEGDATWKNMTKVDDDDYILENVIFDGKDVQFISDEGIRTIKVENIDVYMLEDLAAEAVLEAGDLIVFEYTPSMYSHYDETQSGLSALIVKKHETTGIDSIDAETKAVKVMENGQILIIKNGKSYNALGAVIK